MHVRGSPFSPNGDGVRDRTAIRFELLEPASLTVTVTDHDDVVVRTLVDAQRAPAGAHELTWDGRRASGTAVPNGGYRFVIRAETASTSEIASRLTTRADSRVYPTRPGAIVVALDRGHGGSLTGAEHDASRESDFNLDIGLSLRDVLRGAGIGVAMTGTTDTDVNVPAWDVNGDGDVGYHDEFGARRDVANLARADLYLSLHNNIANDPRVGGPSAFIWPHRVFGAESRRLAKAVHGEIVRALRRFRTATWEPYDHGVLVSDYLVLESYGPGLPRPTLMPGALVESLFLGHPYELELLRALGIRVTNRGTSPARVATPAPSGSGGHALRRLRHPGRALRRRADPGAPPGRQRARRGGGQGPRDGGCLARQGRRPAARPDVPLGSRHPDPPDTTAHDRSQSRLTVSCQRGM